MPREERKRKQQQSDAKENEALVVDGAANVQCNAASLPSVNEPAEVELKFDDDEGYRGRVTWHASPAGVERERHSLERLAEEAVYMAQSELNGISPAVAVPARNEPLNAAAPSAAPVSWTPRMPPLRPLEARKELHASGSNKELRPDGGRARKRWQAPAAQLVLPPMAGTPRLEPLVHSELMTPPVLAPFESHSAPNSGPEADAGPLDAAPAATPPVGRSSETSVVHCPCAQRESNAHSPGPRAPSLLSRRV